MSEQFAGFEGIWVVWDYSDDLKVESLHDKVVDAVVALANQGFGKISFVPFGKTVAEGIEWWNQKCVDVMSNGKPLERVFDKEDDPRLAVCQVPGMLKEEL